MINYLIELDFFGEIVRKTNININSSNRNSIILDFKVFKGREEIDYNEYSDVSIVILKSDGHNVTGYVEILNDRFRYIMNEQAMLSTGIITGQLDLYNKTISTSVEEYGSKLSTLHFNLNIINSAFRLRNLNSVTYLGQLEELIAEFQEELNRLLELANENYIDFEKDIELITAQIEDLKQQLMDLIDEDGLESILEKINLIEIEISSLQSEKANKEDIPTELPANGINNSSILDFYEGEEPIGRLAINSELDVMFPMGVSAFTPNENGSISLGTQNLCWNQVYANSISGVLTHNSGYLDIFSYSQANGEDANGHGYGRMRCYFSPRDKTFAMTASIGGDLAPLSVNYLQFGNSNTTIWNGVASALPLADNSIDLGNSNRRIRNIFVASGSISTSDKTEKKVLKPLDDKLIKDFILLLNPVEYEFKHGLRTHFGLIAQEVEEIVYKLGLNSLDFGGYCRSPILADVETGEYEEVEEIDEDGETVIKKVPITKKEIVGERYGLRYEEFIAPLIKMVQMQEETIDKLEKRVKKLEGK